MAVKYYAQIDFDLFSDPKFRRLSSNDVRFIYLTAHCSKLSNYLGLFRYPVEVWSYDANVKPVEIRAAVIELQSAGLVEYDHDQQTLRLVGWFYSLNGPDNGNQMKGHIKSFLGLSRCAPEIYCRAVAEFTVASFALALHWDNESPEHRKVNDAFRAFLKPMYFKYGEEFCAVLANEINSFEKGAYAPIQAIFHLLPGDGPDRVKPFRKGFETVSKQEKKEEENKINHTKSNDAPVKKSRPEQRPTPQVLDSRLAKEARDGRS